MAGAGHAGRAGGQVPGRGALCLAKGRWPGTRKSCPLSEGDWRRPGTDMDKLKKVLSGQDTEDRSGLSEVSADRAARISWKAALLSSRPRR